MIKAFVDSVLIIDDKEDEIEGLRQSLEEKDIWVTYMNPPKEKQKIESIPKPYKNRKLVFLDLRIDETKSTIDNISVIIRPLLKKVISRNFGSYGIVMWTKHDKHISEFRTKIQKDAKDYQLPLFVIQMDKSKYLKNSFNNVLNDLQEILKNSIAANFFINWSNLIQKGKDKAITSIFELVSDYEKQDKNLEFLLFKIAQNYTGIPFDKMDNDYPLSVDAIKSFNDLLVYEINSISDRDFIGFEKENILYILDSEDKGWSVKNEFNPSQKKKNLIIKKITKNEDKGTITWEIGEEYTKRETKDIVDSSLNEIIKLFSKINSKLLIDDANIQQDKVIPGNIYEIKEIGSKLKHPDLPNGATPIIIEMTPPCDFSNNKTLYPRVLSGYIIDFDLDSMQERKLERLYTELWPIKLMEKEKTQAIFFDFSIIGFVNEDDLKDESKYKLIFRVKDKLFADILQKMTSYMSRLGLSIIR